MSSYGGHIGVSPQTAQSSGSGASAGSGSSTGSVFSEANSAAASAVGSGRGHSPVAPLTLGLPSGLDQSSTPSTGGAGECRGRTGGANENRLGRGHRPYFLFEIDGFHQFLLRGYHLIRRLTAAEPAGQPGRRHFSLRQVSSVRNYIPPPRVPRSRRGRRCSRRGLPRSDSRARAA